jgi:hypothetical protein
VGAPVGYVLQAVKLAALAFVIGGLLSYLLPLKLAVILGVWVFYFLLAFFVRG